tara:strand:+ start:733 stop:1107 length:375 start_codon:yes stop_codon:yes gene_type:complete
MKTANTLSSVLGVVLLLIALQWIFMPASAAESLGMLYLEGDGRNTQIRDFTAFFLSSSIMCFLSLSSKKYEYIFCCGLIYLFAGTFNILASISHDAPLGISSLIAEIVFASMAFTAAFRYKNTL